MSAADAVPAIPNAAKPTIPSHEFFIAVSPSKEKVAKSLSLHSVTLER
jgi:hypothetical protein